MTDGEIEQISPGTRPGHAYRAGYKAGLPFVIPTLLLGISFGALTRSLGWGVVAPIAMSIVVVSASAQFAVAAVLQAGGSP